MRFAPLALAAVLLAPGTVAATAAARDSYGTLTVYGPASGEEHVVRAEMVSVLLTTPDGADTPREDVENARTFTLMGSLGTPDLDLLAWAADSTKRRARLEVGDFAAATRSTYELEGAQVIRMNMVAADRDSGLLRIAPSNRDAGSMQLVIRADHLKINGQAIY